MTLIGTYALFFYVLSFIGIHIAQYFNLTTFAFESKTFLFITLFSVTVFIYSFVRNIPAFIVASFAFVYSVVIFSINF